MVLRKLFVLLFLHFWAVSYSQKVEYKSTDGSSTLILNNDLTFNYEYFAGFHQEYSYGTYAKTSKKVYLKSEFSEPLILPLKIEELSHDESDKLTFFITNEMPVDTNRKYAIILDGKKTGCSAEKTIIVEKTKQYSTFQIMMLCNERNYVPIEIRDSIISPVYDIQDLKSNKLMVYWEINNKLFNYIPLNDTLIFKRKDLVWPKEDNLKLKKVTNKKN